MPRIVQPGFTIEDRIDGGRILESIERYGRTCYKSEAKITAGRTPCQSFTETR